MTSVSCDVCHRRPPDVTLQRCGSCQAAYYCSREHQQQGWATHKSVCSVLKAARAKAAEEQRVLQRDQELKQQQQQAASARVSTPIDPKTAVPPAPLHDPTEYDPESMFNKLKGFAAFEEELANVSLMSRFAADFAPKNLHFAYSYWEEHRDNFREFVTVMLDKPTLLKLAANSVELMMHFNARYGWIPPASLPHIKRGYDNLVHELATNDNRAVLLDAFDELFAVIGADMDNLEANPGLEYLYRHRVSPRLTKLFEQFAGTDRMRAIERLLLPTDQLDVSSTRRFWWPQFLLFATRFFDVYDQALQGRSVKDYNRLAAMRGGLPPDPSALDNTNLDEPDGKQAAFLRRFGQPQYWQQRYESVRAHEPTFDWYVSWSRLLPYWEKHIGPLPARGGPEPHVLYVGCGNSALPIDMLKDGLAYVWSIDRSEAAVNHMTEHVKSLDIRTLAFKTMDASRTTYRSNAFGVVIEKATLDATMNCDNALLAAHAILAEIRRVLKVGGLLFSVSLGDRRLRADMYRVDGLEVVDVHPIEGSIVRERKSPEAPAAETAASSSSSSSSSTATTTPAATTSAPAPDAAAPAAEGEATDVKRNATTYLWVLRKTHDRATEVEQLLATPSDAVPTK
jgi:SAM-dependent methyltransferase